MFDGYVFVDQLPENDSNVRNPWENTEININIVINVFRSRLFIYTLVHLIYHL